MSCCEIMRWSSGGRLRNDAGAFSGFRGGVSGHLATAGLELTARAGAGSGDAGFWSQGNRCRSDAMVAALGDDQKGLSYRGLPFTRVQQENTDVKSYPCAAASIVDSNVGQSRQEYRYAPLTT